MFDLSKIEHDEKAAIHCSTKSKAKEFLECLREQFPRKRFSGDETHWDFYEDDTCYWPNFGGHESLQYGSLGFAIENKYNIYEVEDLIMVRDLPIEVSDIDMKCLFGME